MTKEERDNNFPDVDDGPDVSAVVTYSGRYNRRGMEKKMIVEFDAYEFRRVERLAQSMQDATASESEQLWLVRHVLKSSYSGIQLYHKD
jgi:hypothetical protein